MAIARTEFYQSGFALLILLQKIDKFLATHYDIDMTEMKYLASSLTSQECYDFYNLLSHRRANRGEISIYAEKARDQKISCISLLATWLTDPAESKFRSNENIELKLRTIGRTDLARWILKKIESSLRRRQADESGRRIEETEIDDIVVVNRTGHKILPVRSIEEQAFVKDQLIPEARQTSCIFWKIFFSCLIVLLLVTLVLCFYRFVYTKLRCICQRFENPDDQEYCLPEQTYGTTSHAGFRAKDSTRKMGDVLDSENKEARMSDGKENFMPSEHFSSANESYDKVLANTLAEKRSLLRTKLARNRMAIAQELSQSSKNIDTEKLSTDSQKNAASSENSETYFSKHTENCDEPGMSRKKILARDKLLGDEEKIGDSPKVEELKSRTRGRVGNIEKGDRSKSENFLAHQPQRNNGRMGKRRYPINRESMGPKNLELPRWTSCSCNLIAKSSETNSWTPRSIDDSSEIAKNVENATITSRGSLTGLSETYDELGMLFSLHLKRQSKPCRRKYCTLTRNLQRRQAFVHDVTKCRNRGKRIFGDRIIISWDRRPACSSGQNICRDTYDEYEIMRATREEREILAHSMIKRRKSFLDQPCLSPDIVATSDKLTRCNS